MGNFEKLSVLVIVVIIVLILVMAVATCSDRVSDADADEGRLVEQMSRQITSLQNETKELRKDIDVLKALPTAKRELAAKRKADRRR